MTEDQKLWIAAAKSIGADPEDHEDDELIQPVFDTLKANAHKAPGQTLPFGGEAVTDGSGTKQGAKDEASRELAGSPSNNKDLSLPEDYIRSAVADALIKDYGLSYRDANIAAEQQVEAQYISKQSVLEAIEEDEVWNGYGPTESLKLRGAGIVRNEFRANLKDALGLNNPSKEG